MKTNDGSDTNSGTNSKEEETQTAAMQDEFTRDFLTSSKEVEEGYYEFKSGIDGYTMLFPVNATLDQTYYQYRGKNYEAIYFGEIRNEENYGYSIRGNFDNRGATEWIEENLDLLIGSEKSVTPADFEKYTVEDNAIYFVEYTQNINENENGFTYHFLSYINSQTSNKAMAISYSSSCRSETEKCNLDLAQERERANKIFHSVRFTSSTL